jgi:hypothetical protein
MTMQTRIFGTGRYVLWQHGDLDGYRYTNRRRATTAARESARTTGRSWVTDGVGPGSPEIARYVRGESGRVYRAEVG